METKSATVRSDILSASYLHARLTDGLGLAYVATHPDHERRGAATMLIKWAIDKCKEEKIPAYLESTPMASALYRRLGFGPGKRFHITFEDGSTYEEEGYLFQPDEVSI